MTQLGTGIIRKSLRIGLAKILFRKKNLFDWRNGKEVEQHLCAAKVCQYSLKHTIDFDIFVYTDQ